MRSNMDIQSERKPLDIMWYVLLNEQTMPPSLLGHFPAPGYGPVKGPGHSDYVSASSVASPRAPADLGTNSLPRSPTSARSHLRLCPEASPDEVPPLAKNRKIRRNRTGAEM